MNFEVLVSVSHSAIPDIQFSLGGTGRTFALDFEYRL